MTNQTKPRPEDMLPDDLLWADGGHASDVVLTAVSDGQLDIVPASVLAHVEGCASCTTHLGNAALLSLYAGRELAILASEGDAAARAPLPRLAIVLGLAVAALGLLPSLLDPGSFHSAQAFATHDLPMLASGFGTLARRLFDTRSSVGLVLTYGVAGLLVLTTLAVVRLLPKKETSR